MYGQNTFAQNIHYTQFFNSPLTLNPALTGFTRGDYRVGIAYKNQRIDQTSKSLAGATLSTPSILFDAPVHINGDAVGIGGLFISNLMKNGLVQTYTGVASVSYIKSLGKQKHHQLAMGVQTGYTYHELRKKSLNLYSPFIGEIFIPAADTAFAPDKVSGNLFNLNAGALWMSRLNERVSMYLGGSIFNILQSRQVLDRMWTFQWNVHTGVDITLGRLVHLLPNALFLMQPQINELQPGLSVAYDVTPAATLSIGSMLHLSNLYSKKTPKINAVALYGSFDYKGFKLGLSYDFDVSKPLRVKQKYGALEIIAIYTGKNKNNKSIIFCPSF